MHRHTTVYALVTDVIGFKGAVREPSGHVMKQAISSNVGSIYPYFHQGAPQLPASIMVLKWYHRCECKTWTVKRGNERSDIVTPI